MKSYGNFDLIDNQLQKAVIPVETDFPAIPKPGRILFKDKRLYICAELNGVLPVWVPLTNSMDSYKHIQSTPANVWSINHNLSSTNLIVQVFDVDNHSVIPDEVAIIDEDNTNISFDNAMAGTAIIMFGDITGVEKHSFLYTHYQTSLSDTWVVNHMLGFYPVVRVFVGSEEVQPASIVHNSVNQTTITFSMAYTGSATFA